MSFVRTMTLRTRFLIIMGTSIMSLIILVFTISHFKSTGNFAFLNEDAVFRGIGLAQNGPVISVVVTGLIVGGLMNFLVERLLLKRVADLSQAVNQIGETGDNSIRLSVDGKDEITTLASSINEMMYTLESREADLRRQVEELAVLYAVSLEISIHHDLQTLLKKIVEKAVALLSGTGGGMYLCDPDAEQVQCVVSYNTPRDYSGVILKFGEGAAGRVAQSSEPIIIDDYSTWEWRADVFLQDNPFRSVISVPMVWQGRVIGVIHVLHTTESGRFTGHDVELLTQFANQAAIAVENTKLYEQAQHEAKEAETLRQASAIVTTSLDQKKAIEHILEQLERVIPYDSASVQLLRDGEIEIVGGRGWPDNSDVIGLRFPIPGDNPNTVVIQTREPYILGNAPSTHTPFNEEPHSHIQSWLGVPLIIHDQVIGMLAIDKSQPDYFTDKHLGLANAFANQVAISIENARLYSDIQLRIGELTALRATVADITAELELPKLLQSILKRATRLLNATGGDLGLYEEANQRILVVVSYKMGKVYNGTPMALGEGAMGEVALTLKPIIIDDYQIWGGRSPKFTDVNWHAVVATPLLIGKRLVGVIAIVDEDPERRFTVSDQNLLTMFAQQAAIAVENANLYEEAQRQAITDSLTGLYNRRGLFELGQREVKRLRRSGNELSAIMLDIDHFKQVNDKYSHAVGDQVLRIMAERFKYHLRESDLLGRYGGEEFAVLLPETEVLEAYRIAERLRISISDMPIETKRGPVEISISLGITSTQNGATDLAVLLDRADSAMYQAKLFGRNRIAVI